MANKKRIPTGTLLDADFDDMEDLIPGVSMEDMKFYDDPAVREGTSELGVSEARSSRRKRKTVSIDDPETVTVADEEPPGWAEV